METNNSCYQYYDHINVLIKPTNGCNLRCMYCFHQDFGYHTERISLDTLQHFFDITLPHYKSMNIIWHGGEPSFVGPDFFRQCSDLAIKNAQRYEVLISQTMQTNGTLLTQQFIDILKQNNVSIGISYDGPINDNTRKSTKRLMHVNKLLSENHINYGIIAVVSGMNVHSLPELYEHMKDLRLDFQMSPYIDTSENASAELNMSAQEFIESMKSLFFIWLEDGHCNITVDPFMRMIRDWYVGHSMLCARSSCLRNWFCLNVNGLISPCDRDFPLEYCYGMVNELHDIRQIYDSDGYKNLISKSIQRRKLCIDHCDVYPLCEGGCNNNALYEGGIEKNGGFSCIVTKELLHMVRDTIDQLCLFGDTPKTKNPELLYWLGQQKEKKHE